MDQEYSAFISHSTKDKAVADQLVADLEASGLTCWIAPRDIRPGAVWPEEITRGIESSKCFVLLFTDAANLSDDVYREVGIAADAKRPIYPMRLEDVRLSDRLRYYIASHQWIDALEGLVSKQIDRLRSAIEAGGTLGMGRASGAAAFPRVDNPFAVAVQHKGPILPKPTPGELWTDVIEGNLKTELEKIDLGENGREWSTPTTASWAEDDALVIGGSQRVFSVPLGRKSVNMIFKAPRWRGRTIHDVAGNPTRRSAWVAGNTFFRHLLGVQSPTQGATDDEDVNNPDWCRVCVLRSPKGDERAVLTGLVTHKMSQNWLRRFFLVPAATGNHTRFRVVGGPYFREEIGDWTLAAMLRHRNQLSFSPTGRFVGISDQHSPVFAIPADAKGRIDRSSYAISDFDGHRVCCLTWHPSRDIFACAVEGDERHGFIVFDPSDQRVLFQRAVDRRAETRSLAWSPDGRYLALGGYDQAIVLYDFSRGYQVTGDKPAILLSHQGSVEALHFSPDGQRLLSYGDDKSICIWDPSAPSAPVFKGEGSLEHNYRERMNGSPWSPDGRMFACFGGPAKIRVYRLT